MAEQIEIPAVRRASFVARGCLMASLALCLALAVVYVLRPDAFAAVTVCPPWVWAVPGLAIVIFCCIRRWGVRLALIVLVAWAFYLAALADTPMAMVRSMAPQISGKPARQGESSRVRVISLNCGSAGRRSGWDVLEVKPQIVLLQESPGIADLESMAQKLFPSRGQFLRGVDAAIVADGRVEPLPRHDRLDPHALFARVELTSGAVVHVVSLRLEPAVVRLDFWSADCWRVQANNRRLRRQQLRSIADRIKELPVDVPLIVGGDFNAPAGDAIFRELAPRLRDAFAEAGVGWGNTIINEAPFARIDQIWIDDHWQAIEVRAQATLRSDHRMVIADLALN